MKIYKISSIYIFTLVFLLPINNLFSQTTATLTVDYNITAVLDTSKEMLKAKGEIKISNKSFRNLDEIMIQLWANAYTDKKTYLSKNLLGEYNLDMYFAKNNDFGGYESLHFLQDGDTLHYVFVDSTRQIIKLSLKKAVIGKSTESFNFSFDLKIPKDFNGFGKSGDQYNMTTWYPKVGWLENKNWYYSTANIANIMYGEFGQYNVRLIVPKDFTVGTSGKYYKVEEITKKDKIFESYLTNPKFKISSYFLDSGQDFVWVASPSLLDSTLSIQGRANNVSVKLLYPKRMNRRKLKELIQLCETQAQYMEAQMQRSIPTGFTVVASNKVIKPGGFPGLTAVNFNKVASIPYPLQLTKYIATTCIKNTINFQDVNSPWIGEGLGTYYGLDVFNTDSLQENLIKYRQKFSGLQLRKRTDKIESHVNSYSQIQDFTSSNEYTNLVSLNSGLAFKYLEAIFGNKVLNTRMTEIFGGFQKYNISDSYLKDLYDSRFKSKYNWFFTGLMQDDKYFRYSIDSLHCVGKNCQMFVKNDSSIAIPYYVGFFKKGKLITHQLNSGHYGYFEYDFKKSDYDRIELEYQHLLVKDPKLKTSINVSNHPDLSKYLSYNPIGTPRNFIFPAIGYNLYDGFLGGFILNHGNDKLINYGGRLYFGNRSREIVGDGAISLDLIQKNNSNLILYTSAGSYNKLKKNDIKLRYIVVEPGLVYKFNSRNSSNQNILKYSFFYMNDETFKDTINTTHFNRYINKITYSRHFGNVISSKLWRTVLEYQSYNFVESNKYLMINTTFINKYMYKKNRYITSRFYAGTYLFNSNLNSTSTNFGTLSLIGYNVNDYAYEMKFLGGRTAQDGFWTRQINMNTGGFKTALSNAYQVGQSNKYVASVNLVVDLPMKIFIKPFLDLGMYGYLPTVSEGYKKEFLYSAGLLARFGKRIKLDINLPLINSAKIEDVYKEMGGNWILQKISFSIFIPSCIGVKTDCFENFNH